MADIEKRQEKTGEGFSDIVEKEIDAVLHTDEHVSEDFNLDVDTFNKAEYTKSILGGIDPDEFKALCDRLGFAECMIYPQWFLGQGAISHGQRFEDAAEIGRASCRERVCQYGKITLVAVTLKKK